jgi:tripartite ATP-independent transporter DctP family solute receptor
MGMWRAGVVFGVAGLCSAVAMAQTVLRVGMQLPESHPSYQGVVVAGQKLEQLTHGALKLRIFPNSQLGDFKAMIAQTQAGELDLTLAGYPDMSYLIPRLKLMGAPYVISDYRHLQAVIRGPYGQQMNAAFQQQGLNVLDVWYEGTRHTSANRAIESMVDLKGLKLRTPNVPFLIAYAKAVGATPAPVAFAEVYLALQTKQVDAQENPLPTMQAAKLYEVQSHIALTGHFVASSALIASEKSLAKLSAEQGKALRAALELGGQYATQTVIAQEKSLIEDFKKRGIRFTQPDTRVFRQAMAPYYASLEAEFGRGEIQKLQEVRP